MLERETDADRETGKGTDRHKVITKREKEMMSLRHVDEMEVKK